MNHRHPGTGDTQHDDAERILVEELRKVLHRVADASFEVSVTYDIAKRVLKEEFIANTHRRLLERGEPATQSQIGFLTGIDTGAIREVLDRQQARPVPPLTVEERIVRSWASEAEFLDLESGLPARLIIHGAGSSFERLISRITRGVTPKTVIQSMAAKGVIEVVDKYWIDLLKPDWKSPPTAEQIQHLRRLRELIEQPPD